VSGHSLNAMGATGMQPNIEILNASKASTGNRITARVQPHLEPLTAGAGGGPPPAMNRIPFSPAAAHIAQPLMVAPIESENQRII
jgi:hypothetical protein